jgi:hypothetical protein
MQMGKRRTPNAQRPMLNCLPQRATKNEPQVESLANLIEEFLKSLL